MPPPQPSEVPAPRPTDVPGAPPAASAKVYGLNELVRTQRWEMAVAAVERPGTAFTWSRFGGRSVATGTWIVVDFDLKNTGEGNATIAATDVVLLDSSGAVYAQNTTPGAFLYGQDRGGQPFAAPIRPGATARYYLIFDVPPAATGLQLVFRQGTQPLFALGNAAP
jgi:hypothetical protein